MPILTVQNGATMSAITRGSGKGGTVNLQVAGDVSVLNNGRIATDTLGSGQAGDVLINAQNLLVNLGEVSSNSSGSLSGNAGSVGINLGGTLTLLNSGLISSSTKSILGAAGSIEANAGQIVVDGGGSAILADALVDSSGQTGSLMVNATSNITLSNGGILSIRNDATVPNPGALTPTVLSVSAPNITLKDASITAESTGNSNASDIRILFTGSLVVDPSSITTSANLGNGGDITIGGGQLIQLDNPQITTSVGGTTGNGGDINIQANSLVLNTGFIQANTAAAGASGGNVNINVQTLLPSGNSLTIGGSEPAVFQPGVFGLNVIQAAAPTGVSGTIHSTVPTLDVAENLSGLTAKVISFGALGKDLCRMGARSSFTPVGRGGLRPGSTGMIRPEAQTTASEAATGGHAAIVDMRDGTRLGALAECRY
jgi:large exoprotein involved in heme utilization and adhesion